MPFPKRMPWTTLLSGETNEWLSWVQRTRSTFRESQTREPLNIQKRSCLIQNLTNNPIKTLQTVFIT